MRNLPGGPARRSAVVVPSTRSAVAVPSTPNPGARQPLAARCEHRSYPSALPAFMPRSTAARSSGMRALSMAGTPSSGYGMPSCSYFTMPMV